MDLLSDYFDLVLDIYFIQTAIKTGHNEKALKWCEAVFVKADKVRDRLHNRKSPTIEGVAVSQISHRMLDR